MITALISTFTGLLSGLLPDILKEIRDSRNQSREMAFLELQHRLQMERERAGAENKMREAEALSMAEEMKAWRETVLATIETAAKPTGIPWIDGFNAILRPATAALMMVLFGWTAIVFMHGVMDAWTAGKIANEMQLASVVWGSLLGEAIQAVLGFLFGYRSTRKVGQS